MFRIITIAAIILTATAMIAEAATVRAVVDRNRVTVGESLSLQITIEGGDGDIDLSGVKGFKTISRGSTNSFQMVNGRTSRQMIYNYVLIPLRSGSLTIPGIPVVIDGQTSYTSPITINVSKEPAADSSQRDIYVTARVSDKTPWVGQQIAYTFRLFNAVQVADAKFQQPDFEGFHADEIENNKSYRKVINGREFIVTEVVFILVPVKAGTLTIDPAVLQAALVQRSRQRRRPFSGMDAFFGRTETTTRILQTDPVTVTVRELPPKPPGSVFSGLVGYFAISATLDKTNLQVGDSTTLAITISGNGNIMDAAAPQVPVPDGFKIYADNPEEKIQKSSEGITGSKTFRTALVPVKPGDFHLDPLNLTYFDVKRGAYRTMTAPSFDVHVSPSATGTTDIDVVRAAPQALSPLKKKVEFTGRDILPLKEELDALESEWRLSPVLFGGLLVLPALGFFLTLFILRTARKDRSTKEVMLERARQALKTAAAPESTDTDFLSSLYRALVSAILGRQGIMGTSLTWSEAKTHLTGIGWDEESAGAAARLLEEIESFNYSGGILDAEKRADLLDRSRQTVRRLAK